MKTIAIIPARGGSKGIINKNIKNICGKSLIEYTINQAKNCKNIDHIVVSSDSNKILEIALSSKVNIHKRDSKISQDSSPINETIKSVLKDTDLEFDLIILLQPTSPIRFSFQIDESIEKMKNKIKYNSLISVCEMDDVHPARMYWNNNENELESILPQLELTRRQDIPKALYRNGSIYIVRAKVFMKTLNLMEKPSIGYTMPTIQLLNIDEERDLIIAESLMKFNKIC